MGSGHAGGGYYVVMMTSVIDDVCDYMYDVYPPPVFFFLSKRGEREEEERERERERERR